MTTKIQKIFAYFIRATNPKEREAFRRKLRGVKDSEVSYTKDGQKYTIHGNIPWTKPGSKKLKPKRRHKQEQRSVQHSDPGTGPRRRGWIRPKQKPRRMTREEFERWESDKDAQSVIKRRNRGGF